MTVTVQDKLDLIRLAALIGRHRDVLSTFEAELVDECVRRFRDRGETMSLTIHERDVLVEALRAMTEARAALEQSDDEAAAGMRGTA